ncbi:MAG TPA: hypothetical protein VGL59_12820, partial [Polyangia bacterium]
MFRKLSVLALSFSLGVVACGGASGAIGGGASSGGAGGGNTVAGPGGAGGETPEATGGAAGTTGLVDASGSSGGAGMTNDAAGGSGAPIVSDDGGAPPLPTDGGAAGGGAHQSGGPFVGPLIAADCPDDPTAGWTEYIDTFQVEKPYDLPESQRFTFAGGIFTFWILPTDKPHDPGNTTDPRTEARWSNFGNTRPHLWSADMMFEKPSDHVTIMQVHTTASGAGPVYLRVDSGDIHPLNGSNFVTGLYDTWFNLKVAIDPTSLQATIWINNCQKVKAV